MSDKLLPVVELFGPTLQGEGMLAGRPTHFVRFGGCDFTCAWCDSSHAVLPAEVRKAERISVDTIVERLCELPGEPEFVTLSGGNPALHDLGPLVHDLHALGYKVAVETQGSRWRPWLGDVDVLTVSPKPPSSGQINRDLKQFLGMAMGREGLCLKVPIFDEPDLKWARNLHHEYETIPFYLSVVTRMGGLYGDFDGGAKDTTDQILRRYRWVAEAVANDSDWGNIAAVLPQLHVLIWGHRRGV